ncbi:peptidyl-prolyl cis-trans isomerase B (cyclophilin B) [Geodermatophilus dictyosporus]|uniref:Peptidyl-prolyl cis-trans isomerase B (Cyclophilin B) n=1 Tax=Geodermatophilus dictyosporus TaxID=1523247 RepID=A0A1I5PYR3_9ACTN|nr:peptidylprolyl isomerase [Geodermatophilus dictyosporus]SFP39039.1 peptidyl-prolyl cis-trans isomerase B (cyclophilin B) [Geodermatophilus dictyosporus]
MPTNKQRRVAAQRRLQRQLERRAELARRRRRNLLVVVTVAAVALVAGAVALVAGLGGDDDPGAEAATSSSSAAAEATAAPATTNADGTVACTYAPDTSGNTDLVDAGTPPDPAATPATGTVALLMSTSQGEIPLTLDRAKAPCAAASFVHLAQQQFFDGSPCHREVNAESFGVLQCGDPTGTGQGGPTYKFAEEVTPETTYPRGTIAMANSGTPGSTGSQFFLVFTDSQLPPDYTVVGTVDEAGLAVLDTIAAAGNDGSFEPSPGGGAPNLPVTIDSMTVVA